MMLNAETIIEIQFVTKDQLAPQLLVTLMRRHVGLCPDMAEMRKLHSNPQSYVLVSRNREILVRSHKAIQSLC